MQYYVYVFDYLHDCDRSIDVAVVESDHFWESHTDLLEQKLLGNHPDLLNSHF